MIYCSAYITLALFDPGKDNDFVQGDVIVFPLKKLYRYGSLQGLFDTTPKL
jgi:hypothetical protein